MSDVEELDNLFLTAAKSTGGLHDLIASFFGFLARRSDFFDDLPAAEKLILAESQRCVKLRRQKRREEEAAARQKEQEAAERAAREKAQKKTEQVPEAAPVEGAKPTPTETKPAEQENAKYKVLPGNGYKSDRFWWTQTLNTVEVNVPLGEATVGRLVTATVGARRMTITHRGKMVLDEEMSEPIKDSMWTLVDKSIVQLTLDKVEGNKWWKKLFVSDDFEIDSAQIQPENSSLSDLDPETRSTVEKMLFEQRQKHMFQNNMQPTDDKMALLKRFQESHPELDFSKAQVNF